VTRGLDQDECHQYLHLPTCPASPPSASQAPEATPPSSRPTMPPSSGIEGAYRVSVAPEDVPAPPLNVEADAGDYTLSLVGDTWRLHWSRSQLGPSDTFFNDEMSGTYRVSGDGVTLRVEAGDSACFGAEISGRWTLQGQSGIAFAGMTFPPITGSCGPQDRNDAWLQTIFEAGPWVRIP
jgi:hypothetical protein